MKIWFIIVLVAVVGIAIATYNWFNAGQEALFQTYIQPRITPKLAIDVEKIGPTNWIYLTDSKTGANLSGLGEDISVKILRGDAGRVYRAKDYGPATGLTYSLQGTGGDYRLEVSFAHPEQWPQELSLKITPSP